MKLVLTLFLGAPGGQRFANLSVRLFHALSSNFVSCLLRVLVGTGMGALVGGLLFAVHPVHTESVAFVAGRKDLMTESFLFVAYLLWARLRQEDFMTSTLPLAIFGMTLLAALSSKELAILFPAVLLAWEMIDSGVEGDCRLFLVDFRPDAHRRHHQRSSRMTSPAQTRQDTPAAPGSAL